MPAKEPSSDHLSIGPSSTHTWLSSEGRRMEIESGKPLLHRFCTTCHRNFVCDLSTGGWFTVFPRIFDFERLDHLSERWLKEACPGEYLNSDAAAGKSRHVRPLNSAKNSEPEQSG
jgi:hypothetical protein